MTKNKFILDKRTEYRCRICGDEVKKENVSCREVYDDGTLKCCKACGSISRKKELGLNLNNDDIKLIKLVFNDGIEYLNEAIPHFENKTLKDICLIWDKLNINGKKVRVKTNCGNCGKEVITFPCKYIMNENVFCKKECYYSFCKEHAKVGAESKSYKRIETKCSCCGKKINVIPYHYNEKNAKGDSHNFCSRDCYYKFSSSYYVGENATAHGRKVSDETKDKLRKFLINQAKNQDRLNSSIQLKINDLLDKNNIKHEREKTFEYYSVDNYLEEHNLIIEVMGDYWHGNPNVFNEGKYDLNKTQARGIHTDKTKHTYIKNKYDIEILYLWEKDINENIELCEKLIKKYIETKGKLKNYHSFNYTLINGSISKKDVAIIPYQDMPLKEYEKLIKKSA